jgi:hypothetical protein
MTTAQTIAAALRTAIDDISAADDIAQAALHAVATALEDRAELTRAAEPYATRSIEEMLRAADRVRDLIHFMDEADATLAAARDAADAEGRASDAIASAAMQAEGLEDDTPEDVIDALNASLLARYERECGR